MRSRLFLLALTISLLPCCQSSKDGAGIVPKHLQGYWQFEVENPDDWAGPLLGPNFVEHYYDVSYVENVNNRGGDTVSFTIKLPSGSTTEFRMFDFDGDQASIYYTGWNNPERCTKKKNPANTVNVKPTKLPADLYRKWADENSGELVYEFKKDGTVLLYGKNWNIVRAGYYERKNEYRLLINNGNEYMFLYTHAILPNVLNIVEGSSWNRRLVPEASDTSVYVFKGNWKDSSTGNWELGFFEDFAIYKSEFWEYGPCTIGDGENKIVLKKDGEQLEINMKPLSDSLGYFVIGKEPSKVLRLTGKYLGEYPSEDAATFKDNGYNIDTVTITGYVRGVTAKDKCRISTYDWFKEKDVDYIIQPDEKGRFTLKIPVLNSQMAWFQFPGKWANNVLEPGEEYFYYYNAISGQELWMGDNVRLQNEIVSFKIERREYISYEDRKKIIPDDLLDKWMGEIIPKQLENYNDVEKNPALSDKLLDKWKGEQVDFKLEGLKKTEENYPVLSDKFRYYHVQTLRYDMGSELMQKRFDLYNTNEKFSKRYMDFVEKELVENPMQPYTLVSDFSYFIRDYVDYMQDKDRVMLNVSNSLLPVMEYIDENGILKLTAEEKRALKHYKVYSDSSIYLRYIKKDSIALANLGQRYSEKIKPVFTLLENQDSLINEIHETFRYIEFSNHAKNTGIPEDLKELLIARHYYKLMGNDMVPLKDNILNNFKQDIHNGSYVKLISDFNDNLIQIDKGEIKSIASLKDNGPLEGMTDAKELFAKIIEPYKGKVIYVDFWGTWCGPCKEEMGYVKDVKKEMENKDIIFLYFAYGSPEQTWKNFIKEFDLTGDNAVHYNLPGEQQDMLNTYMKVKGFPSYFIIDKEGEIVDMEAPRPSMKQTLVATLNKWIDK